MLYNYGKLHVSFGTFLFQFTFRYFWGVFNNTVIPLALSGFEMIKAKLALYVPSTIYHFIQNISLFLKGQCHKDFTVFGQFCAKIITLRL